MKPVVFFGVGLALFLVALLTFLTQDPWLSITFASGPAISPNVLAGLASLGFSIGGGLSMIAAALASRERKDD